MKTYRIILGVRSLCSRAFLETKSLVHLHQPLELVSPQISLLNQKIHVPSLGEFSTKTKKNTYTSEIKNGSLFSWHPASSSHSKPRFFRRKFHRNLCGKPSSQIIQLGSWRIPSGASGWPHRQTWGCRCGMPLKDHIEDYIDVCFNGSLCIIIWIVTRIIIWKILWIINGSLRITIWVIMDPYV